MKPPDRQRLALAAYILRQLDQLNSCPNDALVTRTQELCTLLQHLEKASGRLAWCNSHRLLVASGRQTQQLATVARELFSQASGLMDMAGTHARMAQQQLLPGIGDVYRDLVQLEDEFSDVQIDSKNHLLTVTTSPITLRGLYLGPFQIRLKLSELPHMRRRFVYSVVATDPQPASSNELVTHPHVRDEELCEGDATAGIRQALESGRICDFFMLVRSVLEHYNPGSPYVSLDDWDGSPCQDCNCTISSDERCDCEGCQQDFCDDCIGRCQSCDTNRCNGCLEECHECGDGLCRRCQQVCNACSKITCGNCLEENLCPACREKDDVSDDTADTQRDESTGSDEAGEPDGTATTPADTDQELADGHAPASSRAGPDQHPAHPAQAA